MSTGKMQSYIQNTSLKRTWQSFQSTALHSLEESRTAVKTSSKFHLFPDLAVTAKPSTLQLEAKIKKDESQQIEIRPIIEEVSHKIAQDQSKSKRQVNSKFMRHFYYRGITRIAKHPLMNVPKVVTDLYDRELHARMEKKQKAKGPPTTFSQGFLKHINCLYYAVQNTIVFVSVEDLLQTHDASLAQVPYIVQEVRNQVITIAEIVGDNLLFPTYDIVLAVVYPWEIQFFAWQDQNLIKARVSTPSIITATKTENKLKSLHYVYSLPCQRVKSIGVNADGRLFFFDERGFLHQMLPVEEIRFLVCKTGKYSIKNYINNSHNTFEVWSSKQAKLSSLLKLASNISQFSKYFFPSTIQAEIVFCDSKRQVLFGLLKKNTKLLFGSENELFVVCYCVKQKAKLLHKFSERYFTERYGSHIEGYQQDNYLIQSIHQAPTMYQNANLAVLTKSGILVILQIELNNAKVVDVIRPPDHRMFEGDIKLSKFQQFSPNNINEYQVCSFLVDKSKTICTLRKENRTQTYIAAGSYIPNAIDVNQQVNLVDLEIYKQGWKVDVHAATTNTYQIAKAAKSYQQDEDEDEVSQLCSQTFTSLKSYVFQSQTKLQLIRYLRLVDVLFTALCLLSGEGLYRKFPRLQSIPKQTLILKLFLSSSKGFSVLSNPVIGLEELSAMLLQIAADEDGRYYYCCVTAGEIAIYWNEISQFLSSELKTETSRPTRTMSRLMHDENYGNFNSQQQDNKVHRSVQLKIGYSQYYEYDKISRSVMQSSYQLMQRISQGSTYFAAKFGSTVSANPNLFYEFPTAESRSPQTIAKFKMSILTLYLSHLVQPIWNTALATIQTKFTLLLISKIESILKYVDCNRSGFEIYENSTQNEAVGRNLQNIIKTMMKMRDLLMLLNNVPTTGCSWKFMDALQKQQQLEDCMFWAIHREYKHYIISKWQSMFPSFVRPAFVRLIMLYGEIEELSSKQQVKQQMQDQQQVNSFPSYFIKYLTETKRLTKADIDQILSAGNKSIRSSNVDEKEPNDNEFEVPAEVRQIFDRYSKVETEINEGDLALLIQLLMCDTKSKLTIVNKHNLMILLRKNLPASPKLEYVQKCIAVQYELYRYYLDKVSPQKPNKRIAILPFIKQKPAESKSDPETLLLLRFTTLTQDRLRQLIWATADYWLMADFCLCFGDLKEFTQVFKKACEEYATIKPRPSSFETYIERFLLNFAIKSKHSEEILSIVCSQIDQYLRNNPETSQFIDQWLGFARISEITDTNIWLPKLLIKLGYMPDQIFYVFTVQLESSFDSLTPLTSQTLYCLKFLENFVLTKLYLPNRSYDLTNRVTKHIDALERNEKIQEKSRLGLRKMLDQLASISSSLP